MSRFLVITYVKKPNGQMDEMMTVVKHLKDRDLQTGSVILDFKKLQIVKASLGGDAVPRDWDRIVQYYYEFYEATIDRLFYENGYEVVKPEKEEASDSAEAPASETESTEDQSA